MEFTQTNKKNQCKKSLNKAVIYNQRRSDKSRNGAGCIICCDYEKMSKLSLKQNRKNK